MSLEDKIEALTIAINANTAALSGGAASTTNAASTKASTTKGKTSASKPKRSIEEAQAAVTKIKDEFGLENAKDVLKSCKVEKLASITDATAEKVFAAAEAKYEELSCSSGDTDEEDGI